jgi:16S rRNA pseudouridine516 synthase
VRGFLREGRVTVDGAAVRDGAAHVEPGRQSILLDGRDIEYRPVYTFMLHKPPGVVSSTDEPGQRTVIDLLPPRWRRVGLAPAGRLDKDSTGLLLLTSDGQLARRITAPGKHLPKRYRVTVDGALTPRHTEAFAEGVKLADGTVCKPAELKILSESECEITLYEGKYHQIKRMMAALGCSVTRLHRFAVGGLILPDNLLPGDLLKLTERELNLL